MSNLNQLKSAYDVVIIGGGWAGLTLARQLKRNSPDCSIVVIEANNEYKAKVGEATVEMTGHYFIKQLGLVNYLYRNHLPKNGLRFFYDNPDHTLLLSDMSEHGTSSIPPHPAFQLDRARLESDLVDMNRDNGISVVQGVKAKNLNIVPEDEYHTVGVSEGDSSATVSARWLVDCSGRNRFSKKHKKLTQNENVPRHFSAWARFKNVRDIDSMGDENWRKRAFGRFLSTNHFSGDGYWVWFIPLSGGYTSVGIVGENSKFDKPPTKQQAFLKFLAEYSAISELLEGADLVDFEAWGQLAYRADEFIFPDRWATSGFSSMFLDPLFSGGGDMIALFNDHICQHIIQDLGENDREGAQKRLDTELPIANKVVREFYQGLYAHVANVYPVIDSAELCSPLLAYNTAAYFLEIVWDYMSDNYLNQEYWLRKSYLRRGYMALELILQRLLIETAKELKEQDRYYRRNCEGFFESGADHYKYFVYLMGTPGKDGWRIDLRVKLWVEMFLKVIQIRLDLPKLANRTVVQQAITLPDLLQKPNLNRSDSTWLFEKISSKLTEMLNDEIEIPVAAVVSQTSFHTDAIEIIDLSDGYSIKELEAVTRKAQSLWMQTQEYIAMPSMVPVFLAFARGQPDSIMDSVIDQRKNLSGTQLESASVDLEVV
ncbi:tryptophan 7-halogenase [Microbulbifer sp. OS29]|uniref:Tryptophan 7-halogenase n=1 Tax=Microbulbifer okhotskensis TaxID=2926617 RepID=A0A9X2J4P7_9GAMM|nr:tryptophan 7-halogenase [Microbulbifer okhotskensis]MCO1334752.1 tryptophan 7-halogenase [Microbulbifer okhotskensis]